MCLEDMQKAGGQRNRDNRGGDRDYDNRSKVDKDGFRSALPRPDIARLKRDIATHDKEIATFNKEISEIKSSQEKIRNERNSGRQEFENAKRAMSKLLNTKKALHAEKSEIEATREAAHKKITAGQDKEKAAKASIKFNSVEAIDKQIKELEKRQARTSMSLMEEKNLVKEITALTLSKKTFDVLSELKAATDRERVLKSGIDKKLADKNGELKEVYKKIDAQKAILDSFNKTSSAVSKKLPGLKKRQEELRALIDAEMVEIKNLRASIKEKEEAHAAAVAEEKKVFLEELAEKRKKEEEAELLRHPYEEEMFICDFLINYLSAKVGSEAKDEAPVTAPAPDQFSGMKSLKRDDAEETFMGGVVKKKSKKKGGQNNKDGITHNHESLEKFSSIQVAAPAKTSSVEATLKELAEKKEYFNGLERGAIPSLKSLRDKKASSKQTSSDSTVDQKKKGGEKKKSGAKKTVFNMESTAEYPEL